MAQAKRVVDIKHPRPGPKVGTGYQGRGGPKREIKGKIPVYLADRVLQECADYGDISIAQYLTGVLTAFYEAGLEPRWVKQPKQK